MTDKFVFDVDLMDGRSFILDKEPWRPPNYPHHLRFTDPSTGDVITQPEMNVAWRRREAGTSDSTSAINHRYTA